jgi:hypothetical protein
MIWVFKYRAGVLYEAAAGDVLRPGVGPRAGCLRRRPAPTCLALGDGGRWRGGVRASCDSRMATGDVGGGGGMSSGGGISSGGGRWHSGGCGGVGSLAVAAAWWRRTASCTRVAASAVSSFFFETRRSVVGPWGCGCLGADWLTDFFPNRCASVWCPVEVS